MAGKPLVRIKKLTASLTEALAAGDRDTATMIMAEVRRAVAEAGLDMPDLPPEANELWVQVTQSLPARDPYKEPVETRLSDETRRLLIGAGDMAAKHMHDLMAAPGLFGPLGTIPVKDQIAALNLVMSRAYGAMPLGAQRVAIQPGSLEPEPQQNIGTTLSMMIRSKQKQPQASTQPMRDITPNTLEDDEDAA